MSALVGATSTVLVADPGRPAWLEPLSQLLALGRPATAVVSCGSDMPAAVVAEHGEGRRVPVCIWSCDAHGAPPQVAEVRALEPSLTWIVLVTESMSTRLELEASFASNRDRLWCLIDPRGSSEAVCNSVVTAARWAELSTRYDELCTINATLEARAETRNREIMQAYTALKARSDDLEKALETLKQTEAQLVQREKLAVFGQLAACIAHEVNNPSAFVLSNLEVLRDDLATLGRYYAVCNEGTVEDRLAFQSANDLATRVAEAPGVATECVEGIQRIVKIVSDLRTFARVDQNEMVPLELGNVVEQTLRILRGEIRKTAAIDVACEHKQQVRGSSGRILQVLVNLVHNSVQAFTAEAPDRNHITLRTRDAGDRVEIEVADNGCGIAPDQLERIFEPFFTTKPAGVGTGLGLPISRSIIERHGGTLNVKSTVGEGTSFVISLPVAENADAEVDATKQVATAPPAQPPAHGWVMARSQAASGTARPAASPGAPPAASASPPVVASQPPVAAKTRRPRLLFVDEDARLLRGFERLLKDAFDVVTAEGAPAALALLANDGAFDGVICELMMAGMAGEELFAKVTCARPELARRFVFLTGNAFSASAMRFLDAVKPVTLKKPFTRQDVQRTLEQVARAG